MVDAFNRNEIELMFQNTEKETRLMFQHVLKAIDNHTNEIKADVDKIKVDVDRRTSEIKADVDKEVLAINLNIRWMQVVGGGLFAVALSMLGILLSMLNRFH